MLPKVSKIFSNLQDIMSPRANLCNDIHAAINCIHEMINMLGTAQSHPYI